MSTIYFSMNDFIGAYGVCFDGFFAPIPSGSPIPVVAVGRMHSTGFGDLHVKRTVKVNGSDPQSQTADGSYTVDPDGTGIAHLTVKDMNDQPIHREQYRFVIDNHNKEVQFVATHITDLNGGPFMLGPETYNLVIRGVGKKQ